MLSRLLILALLPLAAAAQSVEFNRDIRPILSDKCYTCHGPSSASRQDQPSLRYRDRRQGPQRHRPRTTPTKANCSAASVPTTKPSACLRPIAGRDKLSDKEIDTIRRWIDQGAQWQLLWSFIPPKRPRPGQRSCVAAQRYRLLHPAQPRPEHLHPSPEADRRTLISPRHSRSDWTSAHAARSRRFSSATPRPTPTRGSSTACSPHPAMASAWHSAGWKPPATPTPTAIPTTARGKCGAGAIGSSTPSIATCRSTNSPSTRLPGDLLPHPTLEQNIATGFNRNHRTSAEGGIVPEEFRVDYVADRTETTATVWMGLTVGCARCHDHKYDPIPQRDYYRMFAFFNSVPGNGFAYNFGNDDPKIKAPSPQQRQTLQVLRSKLKAAQKSWDALQLRLRTPDSSLLPPDWTPTESLAFRQSTADFKPADLPIATSPAGPATHFDGKSYLEATKPVADFDYNEPFTFAAWIQARFPQWRHPVPCRRLHGRPRARRLSYGRQNPPPRHLPLERPGPAAGNRGARQTPRMAACARHLRRRHESRRCAHLRQRPRAEGQRSLR